MIKNDKNAKHYEKKKTECLDDTPPEEIEKDVSDKKMIRVKRMTSKKNLDA